MTGNLLSRLVTQGDGRANRGDLYLTWQLNTKAGAIYLTRRLNTEGSYFISLPARNGSCQVFRADREAADADVLLPCPRGVEDGIAKSRRNHGNRRLADAGGFFFTCDEVDFDGRSFVHAEHVVVVEIGLHDAAAFDRDGVLERGGEGVDGGAFDLRANAIRI